MTLAEKILDFIEENYPTKIETDWERGCAYVLDEIEKICKVESEKNELRKYEVKVITRGNCMVCGKELTEGLFFCKECEEKGRKEDLE